MKQKAWNVEAYWLQKTPQQPHLKKTHNPTTYFAILNSISLNTFQPIPSTHYFMMPFPQFSEEGILSQDYLAETIKLVGSLISCYLSIYILKKKD